MNYKITGVQKNKWLLSYSDRQELKKEIQETLLDMREERIAITVKILKTFPSLNKIKPEKGKSRQKTGVISRIISILNPLNHNFGKQPLTTTEIVHLAENINDIWRILIKALVNEIDKGLITAKIEEEEGLYANYDISLTQNKVAFSCDVGIQVGGKEYKEFIPKAKEGETT